MADDLSPDIKWLMNELPALTEDEKEEFAQHVGRGIYYHEMNENDARLSALAALNESRRKK